VVRVRRFDSGVELGTVRVSLSRGLSLGGGGLVRRREGRCNRYPLRRAQSLRHPIEKHRRVGDLIAMVLEH
jgi:hypothetical protein